jgi:isopentenyl-diphosphate delta-isomerase
MEEEGHRGVITAARRKLEQELGIAPESVPASHFQFLTRVHYVAESDAVWGEHEVDHILFLKPPADVVLAPNPNEVRAVPCTVTPAAPLIEQSCAHARAGVRSRSRRHGTLAKRSLTSG